MDGRYLFPRAEAVVALATPRNPIHLVELPVLAHPEVRERIDAEHVIAPLCGGINHLDESAGVVGTEFENVEFEEISIFARTASLRVYDSYGPAEFGCEL